MGKKNKKVVVAMSGGVDSSVTALLLQQEGYDIIGITLKTWGYEDFPQKDSGCCSLEAIYNARNVAMKLGIPHYTLDFTERFNETVISNFISEYLSGNTPNPCVLCNKVIKWGALLEKAQTLGADYIATGHYARLRFDDTTGRYVISVAKDKIKDQSYALWQVSQYALSKTILPLGNYTKSEIRQIAREFRLKTADTPDSQEICFVPNDNYRELLEIRMPEKMKEIKRGDIIYKGKKVGEHQGYPYYTIGQRRGLNVSLGKPVYVARIDAENNIVYLDDKEGLFHTTFIARDINLIKYTKIDERIRASVKVRYKDSATPATIEQIDNTRVKVTFLEPKKSITPGQSAVFYENEDVIGGGIIAKIIED
ncbi:MAG: tRNA 2-thiouridine(34) synthase MnmA [Ignavibacteria bacterium]